MLIGLASCHFQFCRIKQRNDASLRLKLATMDISEANKSARRLTAGITDLDTSLTNVHGDDFTHF